MFTMQTHRVYKMHNTVSKHNEVLNIIQRTHIQTYTKQHKGLLVLS